MSPGIYFLDMSHKRAKSGDFSLKNGLVIVRDSVVVLNTITINSSGICLLVRGDVHGHVELSREIFIYGSIAARVMTEPVQYQLQVVLLGHALRVV